MVGSHTGHRRDKEVEDGDDGDDDDNVVDGWCKEVDGSGENVGGGR